MRNGIDISNFDSNGQLNYEFFKNKSTARKKKEYYIVMNKCNDHLCNDDKIGVSSFTRRVIDL